MNIRQSMMSATGKRRGARGFTLVEALVALLALSIGLLGLAGMQLTGLRANQSAAWRTQATYLAYDILDRMRANRDRRTAYAIGTGIAPDGTTVAARDLLAWKANLRITLPSGDGSVTIDDTDNTLITVRVQWDDERTGDADDSLVFVMESRI